MKVRAEHAGALLIVAIAAAGVAAPWLSPSAPGDCRLAWELLPPSPAHPFGTDSDGCDIAATVLFGTRTSLGIGLVVAAVSATIGTAVGLLAGLRDGAVDRAVIFVAECLQAFPGFLLALGLLAAFGRAGAAGVVLALCASGWVGFARIVRASTLSLRERDFVVAARALGKAEFAIARTEIAPNLLGPVAVQASFACAAAILAESGLSFLGFGVVGQASWGALLDHGRGLLLVAPQVAIAPGTAIVATVLALNLLGDGLRDRLDPRTHR